MPRTLLLLRHAKSDWDDASLADTDRPLSGRGRKAAKAMATFLKMEQIQPDLVLCSPAVRTRKTLDALLKKIGPLAARIENDLYLCPAQTVLDILGHVESSPTVMVIGHNPTLEELTHLLLSPEEKHEVAALADLKRKYPTGALAELTLDIPRWSDIAPKTGRLTRFIKPRDLAS